MNGFMRGNGAKESSKLNGDLMLIRLIIGSPVVDLPTLISSHPDLLQRGKGQDDEIQITCCDLYLNQVIARNWLD